MCELWPFKRYPFCRYQSWLNLHLSNGGTGLGLDGQGLDKGKTRKERL